MGITGLIPFLEKASRRTSVNEFAGKTVAIDSYCWLHKGAFSCAEKLTLGQHTNSYVNYCMKYVHMLLSHKIKPILVFDGRHLPAKAQTEAKRRETRRANREKAAQLMKMGNHAEANNLIKRALDITHEMALELIKQCQKINVDCIVAPYEADSQLAYLNISGIADVIITEDSDLLLFGCKKVLFKMDIYGHGLLIDQEQLYRAMDTSREKFSMDDFIHMCILSGCDYLPSLPGIGLGKARKFIKLNTNCDIHQALARLGSYLKMKSLVVTQEYRDAFIFAIITFKHQLVYCPLRRKQVRLNPPPPEVTKEQLHYAGEETDPETALQLALGNYDPFTLKKLHDFDPDKVENRSNGQTSRHRSIWSRKYVVRNDSQESPTRENSVLEKRNVVTGPRSRLTNVTLAEREDNFECEKLNQQEILNLYESGVATGVENDSDVAEVPPDDSKRSPDLVKRNPFLKQSSISSPVTRSPPEHPTSPILTKDRHIGQLSGSENETSPSFLNANVNQIKDRYIRRGRRLRRRIVLPEGVVNESKYFAKSTSENEERTSVNIENEERTSINVENEERTNINIENEERTSINIENEERTSAKELSSEIKRLHFETNGEVNDSLEESENADLLASNDGPSESRVLNEWRNENSLNCEVVQAHLNIINDESSLKENDTNKLEESRLSVSIKENNINELEESYLSVSQEPMKENNISKLYDLNHPLISTEFDVDPDFLVQQGDIDDINCSFGWSDKNIHKESPSNKMKQNKRYSNNRTSIYGKAKDSARRKQRGIDKRQPSLLNFFDAKRKVK